MNQTHIRLSLTNRRKEGACYQHGTQVCLRCPLPLSACDSCQDEASSLARSRIAPLCLLDYAVWRLARFVGASRSRETADRLAGLLDPDQPTSADAYRQRIDGHAALLEQATKRLKPYYNGQTKATVKLLAAQTLEAGRSARAFRRAVEVYEDRARFEAWLQEAA